MQQVRGTNSELGPFYVSDEEVKQGFEQPLGRPKWATVASPLDQAEIQAMLGALSATIARQKSESLRRGISLPLDTLAHCFQLTNFDIDVLLICLATELDMRYQRYYAYLQDDVSRKHPSADLVLSLCAPTLEDKLAMRGHFALEAPLRKHRLVHLFTTADQIHPPLLDQSLKVDDRIVDYLLYGPDTQPGAIDHIQRIVPQAQLDAALPPTQTKARLQALAKRQTTDEAPLILYLQGPYGVGKRTTAEAMCHTLGLQLLVVDTAQVLTNREMPFETSVALLVREALLQQAALYWHDVDPLLAEGKRPQCETLVRQLAGVSGLHFLAGNTTWEPGDTLRNHPIIRVEHHPQRYEARLALWTDSLNGHITCQADVDLSTLANSFRLNGGQIRDAFATALNLARWRNPTQPQISMDDLTSACRLHSNRKLAELAQQIRPHYVWDDLILPDNQRRQLREICNYVTHRSLVYDAWGFDNKLAMGKGVNALFAGPPGTGKTMAASIIAAELQLDLYKIDLSTVVSKYIGETEKNLSRIFEEAESSNAILFFDEADALFGKRTDVRDAHDRYANLEVSYLLQRMEAYAGIAILATNLRSNLDDAFVRRLHFIVEFPFPDVADRRRIWEGIWPTNTPRSPDVDLDRLAEHVSVVGGYIRNIALAAAFLAADNGQVVTMDHLVQATEREYQKMGKVLSNKALLSDMDR
ncbi:MAG: ATP-binding protein [Rhodobacteraceae bacterium]|nr:ATP-binding protein [Paracoccaceae bacterium]